MFLIAVGALAFALLVFIGRGRLKAQVAFRFLALALAATAAAVAVWSGLRGEWLGSLLLIASAIWLGVSSRVPRGAPAARSSRAEAAAILGVAENASREEVEAAYRRLMLRAHPDQGGSQGLAAQLNRARDIMLKGR